MHLKTTHFRNIRFTAHFLERAKQRINLKIDPNTIEYEFTLKELMKKAELLEILDDNSIKYQLIYNNQKISIIATKWNHILTLKTIMVDGK